MKLPSAVKYPALVAAIVAIASTSRGAPPAESWGGVAAAGGGEPIEAVVAPDGRLEPVKSLCDRRLAPKRHELVWDSAFARPAPGSRVIGVLRPDERTLVVVDLAWTRWALDLAPEYLQSVCAAGRRPDRASRWLRPAWRTLLDTPDQRARDEASRLAVDFPDWALDLEEQELELMISALVRFAVNDGEQLRWIHFISQMPPGDKTLALVRVAEASERPFFRLLTQTLAQLWQADPAYRAFCRRLPVDSRPGICGPG